MNFTTSFTQTGGATLTYSFVGSFVAVYGTVSGDTSITKTKSRYSIDGGQSSRFEGSEPGYHVKFYESPTLPEGNHTLTIESKVDGSHIWLDYLVVVSVNTSSLPLLTNGQGCPSCPLPSSTAAGSCSDGAASSSDPRVLVIVSGTLGLVIFIGIVVIIVAVMRRRRNKKSDPPTHQKIRADWSSDRRLLQGIGRDEKLLDSENESQINKGTNDIVDHRSSLDDLSILSPSTTLRRSMTIDENRLKQLLELDRGSAVHPTSVGHYHKNSSTNPSVG